MKRYSQKVSVLLLATLVSCNKEDSFYQQEALNSLAQNNEEIITLSDPTGGEELPPAAQPPVVNPPVIVPQPPVVYTKSKFTSLYCDSDCKKTKCSNDLINAKSSGSECGSVDCSEYS
jgi:hypothetical protein